MDTPAVQLPDHNLSHSRAAEMLVGLSGVNLVACDELTVAVVVPTFETSAEALRTLVEAVIAQDTRSKVELIIVDNHPQPQVAALIADLHGTARRTVRVISEPRPGSYRARNRGARDTSAYWLAFTDADCTPDPKWLSSAIRELTPGLTIAAGCIIQTVQKENAFSLYDQHFHVQQGRYVDSGFAATANIVMHRSTFEAVGEFDARRLSGGDEEWVRRAVASGEKLALVNNAIVRHAARDSLSSLVLRSRRGAGGAFHSATLTNPPLTGIADRMARIFRREHKHATARLNLVRQESMDFRTTTRLKLLAIWSLLEAVRILELARLVVGGQPERR